MQQPFDESRSNFNHARVLAILDYVLRRLRRQPTVLLPFKQVYGRVAVRGQYDRGHQTVPLAQIVGSLGRSPDFSRTFLPQHERAVERWTRVDQAYSRAIALPPVTLYKLSNIYFVSDGHHRISVARQRGQLEIDAHVIEIVVDVPLTSDLDLSDLDFKEEQSDFFEWTDLARLRPGSTVEVSKLGGYLDLIGQINRHRAYLSAERGSLVSSTEAITDWYDHVYVPMIALLRQNGVLAASAHRTEADVVALVARHQGTLSVQAGRAVAWDEALLDYAWQRRGRRSWRRVAQQIAAANHMTLPRAKPQRLPWAGWIVGRVQRVFARGHRR